jgi:hypothetical protein
MLSWVELDAMRAYACRLGSERALESLEHAEAWVHDRGIVEGTSHCSLPSLHVAIHEPPYDPSSRGFGLYPATKWWWGGTLAARPGLWRLRIHRGKSVLVSDDVAGHADPLARSALAAADDGVAGELERRLVEHLAESGPAEVGDVRAELDVEARAFRRARERLERVAAVVSRSVVLERHGHSSTLLRWDQAFTDDRTGGGLEELLVAFVRAAVVVAEPEATRWLSWPLPAGTVGRLVASGRLRRAPDGRISA